MVDFVLQHDLVTDYSYTLLTNLAQDAEELLGNDVSANHETFHLALQNDLNSTAETENNVQNLSQDQESVNFGADVSLLEGEKDAIITSNVERPSEQQSVYPDEDLADNTANVDDNARGLSM